MVLGDGRLWPLLFSHGAAHCLGTPTVAAAAGPTSVATTTLTFVDILLHAAVGRDAEQVFPDPRDDHLVPGASVRLGLDGWRWPVPTHRVRYGAGGFAEQYEELLTAWAAAGYVVAALSFPLSRRSPGVPDGGNIGTSPVT